MDVDLIGAMEARLLAVERRAIRLEDETRGLKRGVGLAQQGVWESWADFRLRPPVGLSTPVVTHTTTISGCGFTVNLPDSIPLTDGTYGSTTLTWDATGGALGAGAWVGCHAGLSYAGGITFALHYELTNTGQLNCSWAGDASFHPVASTCSTTTVFNRVPYTFTSQTCGPPYTRRYTATGSAQILGLYPTAGAARDVSIGPV